MYSVKTEGTYITAGRVKEFEPFEEEFILEEGDKSLARAIIQNGLIRDRLKKTKKNFGRVRECQVIEITKAKGGEGKELKPETDPEVEELLVEATNLGCIPPNYSNYKDNASRKRRLREAIEKKKARVEKALKKQGKTEEDLGYVD